MKSTIILLIVLCTLVIMLYNSILVPLKPMLYIYNVWSIMFVVVNWFMLILLGFIVITFVLMLYFFSTISELGMFSGLFHTNLMRATLWVVFVGNGFGGWLDNVNELFQVWFVCLTSELEIYWLSIPILSKYWYQIPILLKIRPKNTHTDTSTRKKPW